MTQSGSCGAMQTLQIIAFALGPMLPHDSNLSSVESFESQMSYSFERRVVLSPKEKFAKSTKAFRTLQRFGKEISNIVSRTNVTNLDVQILDVVANSEPPNFQVLWPLGCLRIIACEKGALVIAEQPRRFESLSFGNVFWTHAVSPHFRKFIGESADTIGLLSLCVFANVMNCGNGKPHLDQQSSRPDSFVSCKAHCN